MLNTQATLKQSDKERGLTRAPSLQYSMNPKPELIEKELLKRVMSLKQQHKLQYRSEWVFNIPIKYKLKDPVPHSYFK